jgi:uncharacterized repeat protein (TIGR01451 family)
MPAGLYQAFLQAAGDPAAFKDNPAALQAGGLAFRFDNGGMQAQSAGLSWNIAFSSFGRGKLLNHLPASKVVKSAGRLEYRRGQLTEWYRVTPLGLEQGFTIQSAPRGLGQLTLLLDVQTDLQGNPTGDASGVIFSNDSDQALHYDNLRAVDAKGKELKASMSYAGGQVTIQVNDRGAAYPITIDPLVYLQYKLIAVDGAGSDAFGYSTALSGDTALVGALNATVNDHARQGAAYVFTRVGTAWIFQQKLTALDGAAYDNFGFRVALSGDTALVGADAAVVSGNGEQGAAYVFTRSGITWSQQQKLTASDGAAGDIFGSSTALSGDTALVGAWEATVNGHLGQGAAYVFTRSGATWSQHQKLTASDGAAGDVFGYSAALSGDTALVGAIFAKVGSNSDQGAAYVFTRSGTTWSQQQKLTASDGASYDRFGNSAALSGDTALVGAVNAKIGSNSDQGAAYVFTRSGTTWSQQQKLTAADGAASDNFGYSVALSGNTALVGADGATVNGHAEQGAAYLFNRSGTTWSQQQKLIASDGATDDSFGFSAALSGDTALVGAPSATVNGHALAGAAYTFEAYRTDADLAATAAISTAQANPGDTVYLSAVVTNLSNNNANYVVAQVSLPAGLTYVAGAPTQGSFDPSTGSWSMGTLLPWTGATLTIQATVNLIPSQTLTFSNSILSLDTNNANNTASASLSVLSPALSANPSAWSFGLVKAGLVSPAKTFILTNTGQANLVLGALTLAGWSPSSYGLSSDACSNQTLAPAGSCAFNVTFSPGSPSHFLSNVNVPDNAPGNPHLISLDGFGANELSTNGGFNNYPTSKGKIPTGWTASKFSSSDGKDTTNKQEGTASVKITGASSTTKTLSQTTPANGSNGIDFLFTVWAKAASIPTTSGFAQAQVLFYNGVTLVQTNTITLPTGTYDFTRQSLNFTGPEAAYDSVKIVLTYSKAKGTLWFDNLSLLQALLFD